MLAADMTRERRMGQIRGSRFALLAGLLIAQSGLAQTPANTITLGNYYHVVLALRTCARKGAQIQCDFGMTSTDPSAITYKYGGPLSLSKLTDDTHVDHPQVSGYFSVGRGKASSSVTLVKDDTVELIQVFTGADPDVKRVNVIFSGQYITTDLD